MNDILDVYFDDLNMKIYIRLDCSWSPETVKKIVMNLPIKTYMNQWGEELYSDDTKIDVKYENPKKEVEIFDVAFWPEGKAICLFFGLTPISKTDKILPYSPVNIIGRVINPDQNIIEVLKHKNRMRVTISKSSQ
ncbi:MAG TPA: cyclophilin-like family protein [Nitrososphaeraceae archaeon]|nr:cyclophilin-like family protein [Nitrososphaeraceae archaeon]